MQKDTTSKLGTEDVGKLLFKLSAPAIIAQLVNMLYNIVDRIYIGHIPGIGVHALTGVGLTFPVTMVIAAFSALIGMGGAPRAAIRMGENKYEEAEKILGNCFIAIIAISITLTIIFLLLGKSLLLAFGASAETLPYALSFLNTYVMGTIFVQITLGMNPFISTQGFSKISMLSVVIGAGLSVILDPIFIFLFGMGVKGAALANIISQAISAIWVLKFLFGNKTKLKIHKKNIKIEKSVIAPVILLGVSPFVMQSTESLLNVAFNSSLQKYGGDIAVGSMTILFSLLQIAFTLTTGLTQGAQPIVSYNYGAKNNERVKKTFKLLISCSLGVTSVYWLCIMLKPGIFISIFNSDPKFLKTGIWAIKIYMATSFILGAQSACQQTFIAVGQAKWSIFLALLRKVILLIPLIYILPNFFSDKVFAVFFAEPVSDLIATTVTVITFKVQFKKMLDKNVELMEKKIAL
ncbi:MATE family efflux transporter [Clostridium sp. 19966]|uniref:MATE family efflux transporter n=1 Tax=Clostridium sp. 19966 TaxID=2768166 RepID=UPI0028DE9C07|nr:MATE family efflux transporter [Clostridium sp. 19966]MDT8718805.1 MATE family efflux transporter [Clostridium sp. 19966]